MNEALLKLADFGAVGIALALIIYMAYRDNLFNKILNNHLVHQQDIDRSLTEAITKLGDRIDKCPYNN